MTVMNAQAAVLRSASGEDVPLLGVSAKGRLDGLLFELTVEQRYRHAGEANIEAVYTFPLPQRAVLLGLELDIGGRSLKGVAMARKAASRRYEEAIDSGDTAALLEQADEGLYTVNLGNLQAGEGAVVRYRYAELLDRHGTGDDGYVRLAVPTVIAPRYGSPGAAGVAGHAQPETAIMVEHSFALAIDVAGSLAAATLASPSHAIAVAPMDDGRRQVTLRGEPLLDRDFILQVTGAGTASAALTSPDGDAFTTLVSVEPGLPSDVPRPLALKLLVDCSGSMGGESIAVARRSMAAILDRLHPGDAVSITRFGSHVQDVTQGLVPVTDAGVDLLRAAVRGIDADLGGTEIVGAVRHVLNLPAGPVPQPDRGRGIEELLGSQPPPEPKVPLPDAATARDILLITDGEVWALDELLTTVAGAGHRLFVVAVGTAPNEPLARRVAETTRGACEFISPHEDVGAAIVRMYQRMRQAARHITRITWPVAPDWEAPLPAAVFPGDTLHLLAGFATAPRGVVVVEIAGDGEAPRILRVPLGEEAGLELLPRVAAARRLAALPADEAAALAEHHQLATPWTSFVVVKVRAEDEKAEGLPELRKVQQMLAAGWGATGSVSGDVPGLRSPGARRVLAARGCFARARSVAQPSLRDRDLARSQLYEVRALHGDVIGQQPDAGYAALSDEPGRRPGQTPGDFLQRVVAQVASSQSLPIDLGALALLGLPAEITERLLAVAAAGQPAPADVIAVFLALLAASPAGAGLTADQRDQLTGTALQDRQQRGLRRILQPLLKHVTADHWDARNAITT